MIQNCKICGTRFNAQGYVHTPKGMAIQFICGCGRRLTQRVRVPKRKPSIVNYERLLLALWENVDWRLLTKKLDDDQRELFAGAIDRCHTIDHLRKTGARKTGTVVDKWWKNGQITSKN